MRRLFSTACLTLIISSYAIGQATQNQKASNHPLVPCGVSPTPGIRPTGWDCAILVRKKFSGLPAGTLALRLENFLTVQAAQAVATSASAVVEARGKTWLLTLGPKGERSEGGLFVAEIGPIPPIPQADSYEMDVAEADFDLDMRAAVARAVHTHPGPEIFYLLTGEQCLEMPSGALRARAGEGMVAPANTPMQLNLVGSSKRDAFFIVIHDSTKPWVTMSAWQPRGLCAN